MGTAGIVNFNFNFSFDGSDIIAIIEILANIILGIVIVKTLQNKLNNKRVLKDHFISEIRSIKDKYSALFSDIHTDNLKAKDSRRRFKILNAEVDELLGQLNSIYNVEKNILEQYQIDLRDFITNTPEFTVAHPNNNRIRFSSTSLTHIFNIQKNNLNKFNDLIVMINNR